MIPAMSNDKLEDFILTHREAFDQEEPHEALWDRIATAISTEDEQPDPLEDFVRLHREDFDTETPPPRLSDDIFAALPAVVPADTIRARTRQRWLPRIGVAAAMLLLLTAAFLLGNHQGYQTAEDDLVARELYRIDPELADAEKFYQQEIGQQLQQVVATNHDPRLLEDLAAIDEATREIRHSLLEVPVSQRPGLVNELIETYRTKLNILLRIQQHIPPGASVPTTTQSPTRAL